MTNTVLANIVSDVPGLEVLGKIYPLHHDHKFKNLMKEKILRHIEPSIDLSEMETANMVKILETLSLRYLELLSQRLSGNEKSEYARALFDMRSGKVSSERLTEAETTVMRTVEKFGKLIIFGDQLTVIINLYDCQRTF